jgi:hypothetical protein
MDGEMRATEKNAELATDEAIDDGHGEECRISHR